MNCAKNGGVLKIKRATQQQFVWKSIQNTEFYRILRRFLALIVYKNKYFNFCQIVDFKYICIYKKKIAERKIS